MDINEIAGVHLGKAGDGSVVKPYVTPDTIDSSLLVSVPRYLNRESYNIDDKNLNFIGYDVWNCYEVSALLKCGAPVSGVVKLKYPADSYAIVESKSLKLYLNSFNMFRFASNDMVSVAVDIQHKIATDLSVLLNCEVEVKFNRGIDTTPIRYSKYTIEDQVDFDSLDFNSYNESPDILVSEKNDNFMLFHSALLRSNCRITNQPDWGDVIVYMRSETAPTKESFLQYIVSMRKENHFHEEICECIYTRLFDLYSPLDLIVTCLYTRRGGIDINPIRTSNENLYGIFGDVLDVNRVVKTLKQ